MELFTKEVMPGLKERKAEREQRKAEELTPFTAAALARKPRMAALTDEEIPDVESIGIVLERQSGKDYRTAGGTYADPTRGGAIPMANRETFEKDSRIK